MDICRTLGVKVRLLPSILPRILGNVGEAVLANMQTDVRAQFTCNRLR